MAGRPCRSGGKSQAVIEKMRELDMAYGPSAFEWLCKVASGEFAAEIEDRIVAAKFVVDHARGKAKQAVEIGGGLNMDLTTVLDIAHAEALRKAAPARRS